MLPSERQCAPLPKGRYVIDLLAAWSGALANSGILFMSERKLSAQPRLPPWGSSRAFGGRLLFEDTPFSEVWADAQRSRTNFVRTSLQRLVWRIRRGLTQADSAIASHADREAGTQNAP